MYVECGTILARSASSILGWLTKIPTLHSKSHVVLFTISPAPSWPESSLAEVVTSLSSSPNSLGCLSAPIRLHSPEKSARTAERNVKEYALCSIAVFDSRHATPFLSSIPGREAPQVGRWHALRKEADVRLQDSHVPQSDVNWETVWAQKENQHDLPEELQRISPEEIENVLYCSDRAPEGLSNSLEYFTNARKLGILSHSTPFLTGRPHTLFYGKKILSSGAVGLCLHRRPKTSATLAIDFPDLQPVTPVVKITDTEGNLIHAIDDKNPSRLLLDAIAQLDSSAKDDTYYVGTYSSTTPSPGVPDKLYNIMSGDPSRGTIALEGDSSPTEGDVAQIFRRPVSQRSVISPRRGLNFYTAYPDGLDMLLTESTYSDGVVELDDVFLAASENGLVVDRSKHEIEKSGAAWRYNLPGGGCNVNWH